MHTYLPSSLLDEAQGHLESLLLYPYRYMDDIWLHVFMLSEDISPEYYTYYMSCKKTKPNWDNLKYGAQRQIADINRLIAERYCYKTDEQLMSQTIEMPPMPPPTLRKRILCRARIVLEELTQILLKWERGPEDSGPEDSGT